MVSEIRQEEIKHMLNVEELLKISIVEIFKVDSNYERALVTNLLSFLFKIYSITGKLNNKSLLTKRAFRSPHHTISQASLVGGGTYPQPGEISLAHHGILFLDELGEFSKHVLEVLRQPMEDQQVTVARANRSLSFPASFILAAATNPCPCGWRGSRRHACRSTIRVSPFRGTRETAISVTSSKSPPRRSDRSSSAG